MNQFIIEELNKTKEEIIALNNKLLEKQRYLQQLRTKLLLIGNPCSEYKIGNYFNEKLSILCVESVTLHNSPLCPHGMIMDWHKSTDDNISCDLCSTSCTEYYCGCDGLRIWCSFCTNKVSKVATYKLTDHLCKKRKFEEFRSNYPNIEVDEMTQLKNKNALNKTLDILCNEMGDASLSLYGLLLFDVDNFKVINDQLGHQAGDEFLKLIGCELNDMQMNPPKRYKNVWCYRDGGDEFAIVFRKKCNEHEDDNHDIYGADIYYDLIQRISRISFYFVNQRQSSFDETITVSVGITLNSSAFDDAEQWKTSTDKAMYVAKECGKNTIRFYVNNVMWNLSEITNNKNDQFQLRDTIRSLPCYGHIAYEYDTSFLFIKLCGEWQDTAIDIAQLCDRFVKTKHMVEYKKALRLAISWASLLNVHHPTIKCITPPSIAGLHISLDRSQITKNTPRIGQKVEFKITNVKIVETFRKLPENITGQFTSSDGLRYYPTLWILAEIEFIDTVYHIRYPPHISLASVAVQLKVEQVEKLHLRNGSSHNDLTASFHCLL